MTCMSWFPHTETVGRDGIEMDADIRLLAVGYASGKVSTSCCGCCCCRLRCCCYGCVVVCRAAAAIALFFPFFFVLRAWWQVFRRRQSDSTTTISHTHTQLSQNMLNSLPFDYQLLLPSPPPSVIAALRLIPSSPFLSRAPSCSLFSSCFRGYDR